MHQHSEVTREKHWVTLAHKVPLDRDRIELLVVLLEDLLK